METQIVVLLCSTVLVLTVAVVAVALFERIERIDRDISRVSLQLSLIKKQGEQIMALTQQQRDAIAAAIAQAKTDILDGVNTSITNETAQVVEKVQALIAAGGTVTAEDLNFILTGVQGIAPAVKTTLAANVDKISDAIAGGPTGGGEGGGPEQP